MPDGGQLITELIIDSASAVSGAQQFTQAADGIVKSSSDAAESVDNLGQSIDVSTTMVTASAAQIRAQNTALASQSVAAGGTAAATLNLSRTQDQLASAITALNRLMATGAVSVDQYQSELTALNARQGDAAAAAKLLASGTASVQDVVKQFPGILTGAAAGMATLGSEAEKTSEAHAGLSVSSTELGHSLRAVTDELSAGIPLYQALRTEAPRLAQALGVLQYAFNPLVLGAAAVAAGIVLIATRAEQTEADLRSFNVELLTFGNGTGATAQGLQNLVTQLRDTGTAATDAKAAISEIISAPGINQSPGNVGAIATLGQNLAALRGDDVTTEVKNVVDALTGGVEATIKFGTGLNALNATEIDNIRTMALHGDAAGAVTKAFDLIAQHIPAASKSLSDAANTTQSLKAAWNDFLDAVANTGVIDFVISRWTSALKLITQTVSTIAAAVNMPTPTEATAVRIGIPTMADDLTAAAGAQSGVVFAAPSTAANGNEAGQSIPIPAAVTTSTIAPIVDSVLSSFQGGALNNPGFKSLINAVIQTESGGNVNAVSPAGAQGLMQLMPGTAASLGVTNPFDATQNITAGVTYLAQLLGQFGGSVSTALSAYNAGPGAVQKALTAGAPIPGSGYAATVLSGAGLSPGTTAASLGVTASASVVVPTPAQSAAVTEYQKATEAALAADQQWGIEADVARAKIQAQNEAVQQGLSGADATAYVNTATAAARQKDIDALTKQSQLTTMQSQGELASADAFQQSEVAGLRETAMRQAQVDSLQTGIPVMQRYNELLTSQATAAIGAAAKNIAATQQTVDANQQLAAAAAVSVQAEQQQQIQNQAVALTQDAVNKALATGNPLLITAAQNLQAQAKAQIEANDAAEQSVQLSNSTHGLQDQTAQLQLQLSLEGQTSEEISKQTDLLKARQTIDNSDALASQQSKDAYVAQTAAVADLTNQLADAQRAQGQLNSAITGIGTDIDNSITQNLANAFSGQKITDWGTLVKQTLGQIESQLVEFALIKPAIGSVLSLLGLGTASQSFGTFGSLLGAVSSLFGGGSSVAANDNSGSFLVPGTDTPVQGASTFSTSDLLQAGGLLTKLFGSSGDGGGSSIFGGLSDAFSGLTSTINSFGTSLGFASPSFAGLTGSQLADLGIPGESAGIFGGSTLLDAAGGPGMGFAAGSLIPMEKK